MRFNKMSLSRALDCQAVIIGRSFRLMLNLLLCRGLYDASLPRNTADLVGRAPDQLPSVDC